jgi:hypothetical protein
VIGKPKAFTATGAKGAAEPIQPQGHKGKTVESLPRIYADERGSGKAFTAKVSLPGFFLELTENVRTFSERECAW